MPNYQSHNEQELFQFLKKGDNLAYAEIYERYWPILFRHARKWLQNTDEAKDVVQDVFTSLWTIAPKLDSDTLLSPYLYTATRNSVLKIFRRSKVSDAHIESLGTFVEVGHNVTDHRVRERILIEIIEEEIANLPTRTREVFELKRKHNLTYREIAEKMEISELTVKTQMNRAIKTLKNKFGDNFYMFVPFL